MIPGSCIATDVPASTAICGFLIADLLGFVYGSRARKHVIPNLDAARVTEFPGTQEIWLAGEL